MIELFFRLKTWLFSRLFHKTNIKNLGETNKLTGRLIAQTIPHDPNDESKSIRVVDRQSRSSATDLSKDGVLSHSINGLSPRGEEDTIKACKVLVHKLNSEGGDWCEPVVPEGEESGIDCHCISKDGSKELNIQVIRAVSDQNMWRELNKQGKTLIQTNVQQAADNLIERVKDKSLIAYPDILLAINAMDTPSHTLAGVIDDFKQRYGSALKEFDFYEVWVVGPDKDMTHRLDK